MSAAEQRRLLAELMGSADAGPPQPEEKGSNEEASKSSRLSRYLLCNLFFLWGGRQLIVAALFLSPYAGVIHRRNATNENLMLTLFTEPKKENLMPIPSTVTTEASEAAVPVFGLTLGLSCLICGITILLL
jgi:type III secretory pathway component EscT